MIRTRFAPSPTGFLHVGGLRTALYSYLLAKQAGGQFLLRVEDTDQSRLVEGGMENILSSLYWAGINPDEGVIIDQGTLSQKGDKGPYIQSERLPLYQKYVHELLDAGHAYYCFCTSERLDKLREHQQTNKMPTGYDGACSKISADDAQQRIANGETAVVRLRMPKEGETIAQDMIRGEIRFKNALQEDFIIMKSDAFPTYHLASVVDDHLMEITHVARGDEWVSSLAKHIQLYTYFGWQPPQFAHLPLLLNPDKSKLSKRQGDVAVSDYTNKGYLAEALVNFVAFLGWNPGTEKELYTMDELIKDFNLEKVSKAGAVFNIEKLNWYNKEYIKKLSSDDLLDKAMPWLEQAKLIKSADTNPEHHDEAWLQKVVMLERERITTLADMVEAVKFMFDLPEYSKELLVWRKGTIEEVQKILPELTEFLSTLSQWTKADLEVKIGEWIIAKGYSTGSVLWPLRVALCGQQNSPGPYEIAEVLGKEETLRRLRIAVDKIA